jgi:hypothetical protein
MVMKRPMVAFLSQLLLAIRSRFTRRARLEAENLLLRQQLVVLRRKSSTRVRLSSAKTQRQSCGAGQKAVLVVKPV